MKYHILINDYIGWPISADYVSRELATHKDQPVDVYVSSLGGDVNTALQIRQMFVEHGNVTCHLHGFVASAATILITGAKTVRMGKFALYMIHKCSSWQDQWGQMNADDIAAAIMKLTTAKQMLDQVDHVIGSIYAQKTGKPLSEIAGMMKAETWMTAEEALSYGFIDEVIEDDEAPALTADLSARIVACGLPLPEITGEENPSMWTRITDFIERSFRQHAERVAAEALSHEENHSTLNTNNKMKKLVLATICALLSVKDFEQAEDGTVNMTEEQLRLLENQLVAQNTVLADKQKEIDAAAEKAKKLQEQIDALQEQVKNLKDADGDDTDDVHDGEGPVDSDDDFAAASEAQASFNRLAGLI